MEFDTLFHSFWSFTVTGLANGSIYALVALGYTLVYGVLRLINFAHSEVFMIGTLASLFTLRALGADDYGRTGVVLLVVILVAFASSAGASAFTAIILERIAYRPLRGRNAPRLAFLISAIGMSLFLQELVAVSLFGHTVIGRVPSGAFVLEKNTLFKFFDANIRVDQIIVVASAILMMVALDQFVRRTRLGRGVRAVSQDIETAQLMGVNIDRVIMLTFLLGGIMAGGAGLLYLITLERTAFNVGFFIGIKAFTAAVLGGIGNLRGALVGGLLLGLIENYGSAIFGTQWRDPISFAVLILVLLFRPTGILGEQLGAGEGVMGVLDRVRRGGTGGSLSGWWSRLPKAAQLGIIVVVLVGAVFLPYLTEVSVLASIFDTPGSDFSSVLFYPVGCYVLVAIGLNIVVGQAGLLDLGYVAFFAIGAYTTAVLGSAHGDVPWLLTVPIGIGVAMTAGLLLGLPTLRLRGDYLAIVTLGFGEIIRITANNTDWLGGPRGVQNIPKPPSWFGLHFGVLDANPYYWLVLIAIVLVIFVYKGLEHSRVGRAWVAIREDEDAAELMGVPTFKFKLWAFAMGAAIGGFSGTLYASFAGSINPDPFNLTLSILFLAAVVLGGSGNLAGAIVGAILIGYLPERFRGFAEYRVLVFGAALVIMMVFRPQGIVPNRRRAAELEDRREAVEHG